MRMNAESHMESQNDQMNSNDYKKNTVQTNFCVMATSSFIDGIFSEGAWTKREAFQFFPLDCSEVNSAWLIISELVVSIIHLCGLY